MKAQSGTAKTGEGKAPREKVSDEHRYAMEKVGTTWSEGFDIVKDYRSVVDKLNIALQQRDELLSSAKEARMALTLDYHGATKRNHALCELSAAAKQAHEKLCAAIAKAEGKTAQNLHAI